MNRQRDGRTDGRTDRQTNRQTWTKLRVLYRNFFNVPKKDYSEGISQSLSKEKVENKD